MKFKDPNTGMYKDLYFKTGDTLPVGTMVDYDGDEVPPGYKEVPGVVASVVISPTEPETGEEVWIQKGKNLIDKTKITTGYELLGKGGLHTNNDWFVTDYIKVEPNKQYCISGIFSDAEGLTASIYIEFYDENHNYIKGVRENPTNTPSNAKYARLNGVTSVSENMMLEQNSTATNYEPYVEKKIYIKNDNGVYEEFYDETNLEVYSLGEQRIGTWIDGKPLYRKVIEFTMALEEGENNIPHGITGLNKVIRKDIVNNSSSMFPYLDTNETASIFKVSSTDVTIKCIGGSWGSTTRQIILEYTKTTD